MKAFILAGGEGKRLRPLTYAIPKPLLPVGEKPVLEILIENLKKQGFDPNLIEDKIYFYQKGNYVEINSDLSSKFPKSFNELLSFKVFLPVKP